MRDAEKERERERPRAGKERKRERESKAGEEREDAGAWDQVKFDAAFLRDRGRVRTKRRRKEVREPTKEGKEAIHAGHLKALRITQFEHRKLS